MSEQLRPCICGGEVNKLPVEGLFDGYRIIKLVCSKCGIVYPSVDVLNYVNSNNEALKAKVAELEANNQRMKDALELAREAIIVDTPKSWQFAYLKIIDEALQGGE